MAGATGGPEAGSWSTWRASEVVLEGLSMPHSPRWHDAGDGGRLWPLDSGTGWFGHADLERGRFKWLTFVRATLGDSPFTDRSGRSR